MSGVPVECGDAVFYHKGGDGRNRNRQRMATERAEKRLERPVIAWDGEGIDLRGPGRPQSYVLFGCSAEPDSPLVISSPDQFLGYRQIIDYICSVGSRHPGALHIGYGFGYDQNMIIQAMPLEWKRRLYEGRSVVFYDGQARRTKYRVKIYWRKRFEVTRTRGAEKVTVRIDDILSFFGTSFTKAYEAICGGSVSGVVVSGKASRGQNTFHDLADVTRYWREEIQALALLGSTFRRIMFDGGFPLSDFYGPGAVANYLRRTRNLAPHEWGAKEQNIPAGVHAAAKSAYYGGRFEQFMVGRITGPVYSLDINSAYPAAFCEIPSLAEGGWWDHVDIPSDNRCFGVYRIRYRDGGNVTDRGIPRRTLVANPLPYRNADGQISYPAHVEGWYWRPEADAVRELYPDRVEIVEGWEWRPANDDHPWRQVMTDMYAARMALKEKGDVTQLAYKLAINSLYGKMAQRVGWDKENKTPPRSHSLAIAGFITSHCRAAILHVIAQLSPSNLVAIETDGVYFHGVAPDTLTLPTGTGSDLGQWDAKVYDEMLYVQNGVYLARDASGWGTVKSRGFSSTLVSPDSICTYLQSLGPSGLWMPLKMPPVSSFIGIGLALQLARNSRNTVNPRKAAALHCQWVRQEREIDARGGTGKRVHVSADCESCNAGANAYDRPHPLHSNHGTCGAGLRYILSYGGKGEQPSWNPVSHPYRLPWESTGVENWRDQQEADEEMEIEEIEYHGALFDALPSVSA